jgi:Regulator of Chromosome Condensation (RCC1) repeat protein
MKGPETSSFSKFPFAALAAIVGLVAAVALGAAACNSSSSAPGAAAAQECHVNSDCQSGLICALGECRAQCTTSADCQTGGTCIDNGDVAVCQYASVTPCTKESDCPAPLACASDYRCRNLCMTAADCNVLGIMGRVCAMDANGVDYCADPSQVNAAGVIDDPPPPGAPDTGVMEPFDATVAMMPDGATNDVSSNESATNPGQDAAMSDASTAGTDANSDGPVTCSPSCTQGQTCIEGPSGPTCTPCGTAAGVICCDGQMCGANLTCTSSGICGCGAANQPCCGGDTCTSSLTCAADDAGAGGQSICACGEVGTRCCAGLDGGAPSCSVSGVCAGSNCTCIVQFAAAGSGSAPGVVLRTDGTVWAAGSTGAYAEMSGSSGPLVATAIAASEGYESSVVPIGCAIVSGGVWCFPVGGTLTDSTDLGAALGATDTTSSPVQVLTLPQGGAMPLTNVTQIAGGVPLGGSNFCAVTSDGSAWCWGWGQDGQLGNGGTGDSNVASQVMASAISPFTNVAEVRIGYDASCARRTDGSVWCWGLNPYDELGVPPTTTQSYYPVQVPFSGSTAQRTATRIWGGRSETFCAIMQDTSVVCWGYNSNGQAGAPSENVGPTSVLLSAGGAPLTTAVDLAGDGYNSMCAKTASLSILCWGADSGGPYPAPYKNSAGTAAVGIVAPLSESQSGLGYIDPSGLLNAAGSSAGPVPPCTNLLP